MIETVEQRQDQRGRSGDAPQGIIEPDRLGSHNEHINRLLQTADRAGMGDKLAKAHTADAQPDVIDDSRGGVPGDDGDGHTGTVERGRDESPDAPGSKHGDRWIHDVCGSTSTPGFMMPCGSTAALAPRRAAAKGSGRWRSYQGR